MSRLIRDGSVRISVPFGSRTNVSDHPYPVGVGTLEWAGHVRAIMDTMLRCHGNMPAGDNEEITSLSSPSAFQTTT